MLVSNWSATPVTLRPSFSVTFSHLVNMEENRKILAVINKDTKYTFVSAERNGKDTIILKNANKKKK